MTDGDDVILDGPTPDWHQEPDFVPGKVRPARVAPTPAAPAEHVTCSTCNGVGRVPPAAPAGSGATDAERAALEWLDHECSAGIVHAKPLRAYLRAQRAAREAAERERDEVRALIVKERAGGDADREWLTTERDEARAALAASTEREAGLREVITDTLQAMEFAASIAKGSDKDGFTAMADALRARLASLAAPEGGTDDA